MLVIIEGRDKNKVNQDLISTWKQEKFEREKAIQK